MMSAAYAWWLLFQLKVSLLKRKLGNYVFAISCYSDADLAMAACSVSSWTGYMSGDRLAPVAEPLAAFARVRLTWVTGTSDWACPSLSTQTTTLVSHAAIVLCPTRCCGHISSWLVKAELLAPLIKHWSC